MSGRKIATSDPEDVNSGSRKIARTWPGAAEIYERTIHILLAYAEAREAARVAWDADMENAALLAVGQSILLTKLEMVGLGSSRAVFALSKDAVVKVSYKLHRFTAENGNLVEARKWKTASHARALKLAPVLAIGPRGDWMVMARTETLMPAEFRAAQRLFLRERDANVEENAGKYQGRLVLHDYAF